MKSTNLFKTLVQQVANSLADRYITHLYWSGNNPASYINGSEAFGDDVLAMFNYMSYCQKYGMRLYSRKMTDNLANLNNFVRIIKRTKTHTKLLGARQVT